MKPQPATLIDDLHDTSGHIAGTKDVALVQKPDDLVSVFERFAKDPSISVEKIERLMALWERTEARTAEAAFNAAMSTAQQEMRPVSADAYNPQTKSKYASYKALDEALRPIYTKHGFGLSFDTGDGALAEHVRVLCYVTHHAGHARTYHADMPADGKGAKGGDVMTKTHAAGSAMSYGMRYLLKMIFNVAVGEEDDDGNRAGRQVPADEAPNGYDKWWAKFTGLAEKGFDVVSAAWEEAPKPFQKYAATHARAEVDGLKKKALDVDKQKAAKP